jgi:glycosyltransferase involved in cell wall biosynthesis
MTGGAGLETTVIVPTFDRAELLRDSLGSVLSQSRPPAEVIVIDDGSSDGTPDVARSFGRDVRYIRQENAGKAAALNRAMGAARNPLIWIVDDDDIACPGALETLTELLRRAPHAGFSYGRHTRFRDAPDGTRHILGTGYWRDCDPSEFLVATLQDFFVHQPAMLVRRSLYEAAGPFDVTLPRSQDYRMLIELARRGACVSTSDVVFLQRQHGGDRGVAGKRFRAGDADAKWIEMDRRIFEDLDKDLALAEYLPGRPETLSPSATRRALLTRGAIMARKKLWPRALRDFRAAAALGLGPLDPAEAGIVRHAFAAKFGSREVLTDPDLRAFVEAPPRGPTDMGSIRTALATGLRWRIREALGQGRLGEAAGYLSAMRRLRRSAG